LRVRAAFVRAAASIQVDRRARRAKSDRIDLEQLVRALLTFLRGEPRVCSMQPDFLDKLAGLRTGDRQSIPSDLIGFMESIRNLHRFAAHP
jgi:transposase